MAAATGNTGSQLVTQFVMTRDSQVIRKNSRRSQFCFNYGKEEEDSTDHTIHLEIKNFLEFARNKTNATLTTGVSTFRDPSGLFAPS